MFRVDERRETSGLLGIGNNVEHQRRFTGRFRSENFHHAAARKTAGAEREINAQRSRRDHFDLR